MTLGSRIRSAFRWGAGVKLLGQLINWAMTIVVIRLLSPEDYGLMAMSVLFLQFLMLINEVGLGAVLIQRSDIDIETRRKIFGLVLIINTSFFCLLFLAAPLIAAFFEEEQLALIIRIMSTQFLIAAFEIIPVSTLQGSLDFKKKSLVYFASSMIGGLATLTLAFYDYGVWALIWGNMLVVFLQTLGVNIVAPFLHLPIFSLKNMRDVVTFGGLVTLERGMWFFYTQADIFIVGKLLGKELLGIYTVAMHLASLVMHKTGGIIYEIAFPSFSRANEEADRVAKYFLKSVRIMSMLVFPLFFGLSVVARELVSVVLGETWSAVGHILSILSLVMPLRMIANLLPPALQGVGQPGASAGNLLVAMIVMPAAFLVGTNWGLEGVSLAWTLVYPLVFMVMLQRSVRRLGVTMGQVLGAAAVPALSAVAMLAVVTLVRETALNVGGMSDPAVLVLSIVTGIAVYALAVLLFCRDGIGEVLALARR